MATQDGTTRGDARGLIFRGRSGNQSDPDLTPSVRRCGPRGRTAPGLLQSEAGLSVGDVSHKRG